MMLMPSILDNRFLDDMFTLSFPEMTNSFFRAPARVPAMKVDVMETDKGFELDVELPGYKKEDVSVKLSDGYMTITAAKNEDKEEKADGKVIRKERYSGSVSRSFFVGKQVSEDLIKARFEDGILKLSVAKPAIPEKKESLITIE